MTASANGSLRVVSNTQDTRRKLPWISARDLATKDFSVRYLVDRILVDGQPLVIGGPEKTLKTSLAIELGLSLASGGKFLGRFQVNSPRIVGMISGESGPEVLQETAMRISRTRGYDMDALEDRFGICPEIPLCDTPTGLAQVSDWICSRGLEFVIIDPAYLALSGIGDNSANVFAMGNALRNLNDTVRLAGAQLSILHHAIKSEKRTPLELGDLSGAGWREFARQWILVNRRRPYADSSGLHELWVKAGGSAGHSDVWGVDVAEGRKTAADGRDWKVTIMDKGEMNAFQEEQKAGRKSAKKLDTVTRNAEKAIVALREYGDWMSKSAIAGRTGMNNSTAAVAVESAVKSGVIEVRDTEGVKVYRICRTK